MSVDTTNQVAFRGTVSFSATGTCETIRKQTYAKLLEVLTLGTTLQGESEDNADALSVATPSLPELQWESAETCATATENEGHWSVPFVAIGPKTVYGKHKDDVIAKATALLESGFKLGDDVQFGTDVSVEVSYQPFELVSGSFMLTASIGCDKVLEGCQNAIAKVLNIEEIFVDVSHGCSDVGSTFPGEDGSNVVKFNVSAAAEIRNIADAKYRANAIQTILADQLPDALKTILKNFALETAADFAISDIQVLDFRAGDQEPEAVTEVVTGTVEFEASNISCKAGMAALEGALMEVLELNENAVKVDVPSLCDGGTSDLHPELQKSRGWSMKFESVHNAADTGNTVSGTAALTERIQDVIKADLPAILEKKLQESDVNLDEVSFKFVRASIHVEDIADESDGVTEVKGGEAATTATLPPSLDTRAAKDVPSTVTKGTIHFDAAATCKQTAESVGRAMERVLNISRSAMWLGRLVGCDDSSSQEEGKRSVAFQVVVPEKYGLVTSHQVVQDALKQGLPPILSADFKHQGLDVDDPFQVTVETEHVPHELVKAQAVWKTAGAATCDEAKQAHYAALEEIFGLETLFLSVRVPCLDGKVEDGATVEFNVTLPAGSQTIEDEIYRAERVDIVIKAKLEAAVQTRLETAVLDGTEILGFTDPQVDDLGEQDQQEPSIATQKTTTTTPAYSKNGGHSAASTLATSTLATTAKPQGTTAPEVTEPGSKGQEIDANDERSTPVWMFAAGALCLVGGLGVGYYAIGGNARSPFVGAPTPEGGYELGQMA